MFILKGQRRHGTLRNAEEELLVATSKVSQMVICGGRNTLQSVLDGGSGLGRYPIRDSTP